MALRVLADEVIRRVAFSRTEETKCAACGDTSSCKVERVRGAVTLQQCLCTSCLLLLDENRAVAMALPENTPLTPRMLSPRNLSSRAKLYRFANSGSSRVLVSLFPPQKTALSTRFCFVLDCQSHVFVWHGKKTTKTLTVRAIYFALSLAANERGSVYLIDEGQESAEFWSALRDEAKSSADVAVVQSENNANNEEIFFPHILYRVSGRVEIVDKGDKIDRKQLNSRFPYVLDTLNAVFVWFGTECNSKDVQIAQERADEMAKKTLRQPEHEIEGSESPFFCAQFVGGDDVARLKEAKKLLGKRPDKAIKASSSPKQRHHLSLPTKLSPGSVPTASDYAPLTSPLESDARHHTPSKEKDREHRRRGRSRPRSPRSPRRTTSTSAGLSSPTASNTTTHNGNNSATTANTGAAADNDGGRRHSTGSPQMSPRATRHRRSSSRPRHRDRNKARNAAKAAVAQLEKEEKNKKSSSAAKDDNSKERTVLESDATSDDRREVPPAMRSFKIDTASVAASTVPSNDQVLSPGIIKTFQMLSPRKGLNGPLSVRSDDEGSAIDSAVALYTRDLREDMGLLRRELNQIRAHISRVKSGGIGETPNMGAVSASSTLTTSTATTTTTSPGRATSPSSVGRRDAASELRSSPARKGTAVVSGCWRTVDVQNQEPFVLTDEYRVRVANFAEGGGDAMLYATRVESQQLWFGQLGRIQSASKVSFRKANGRTGGVIALQKRSDDVELNLGRGTTLKKGVVAQGVNHHSPSGSPRLEVVGGDFSSSNTSSAPGPVVASTLNRASSLASSAKSWRATDDNVDGDDDDNDNSNDADDEDLHTSSTRTAE